MPELIILGGPNGAGKSTFANEYLPTAHEELVFVNADEIAKEFGALGSPQAQLDLRAGREMLQRINTLVSERRELMFETTLASLTHARKIPIWKKLGYRVALIYLRLPNVEASIARVKRRVKAGGHDIPEHTIRQRFHRSLEYLEKFYKPAVDEWYIWDSLEGDFKMTQAWDDV